jgi:hypothetical protein
LQFCKLEVGFLEIDQQQQQLQEWSSLSEVRLEISWSSVKFFEKIIYWRRIMGCEETIAIRILNPLFSFFVGCDLSNGDKSLSCNQESSNSKRKESEWEGKKNERKKGKDLVEDPYNKQTNKQNSNNSSIHHQQQHSQRLQAGESLNVTIGRLVSFHVKLMCCRLD